MKSNNFPGEGVHSPVTRKAVKNRLETETIFKSKNV